jgi:tetratricopeptide (TPR) repeat protein
VEKLRAILERRRREAMGVDDKILKFDDAPIEEIVNGNKTPTHTKADIYPDYKPLIDKLAKAMDRKAAKTAVRLLKKIQLEDYAVPKKEKLRIATALSGRIPHIVHPVIDEDVTYLGPMLSACLDMLLDDPNLGCNVSFIEDIGISLYRWYEYMGKINESILVIERLLTVVTEDANAHDHAVLLNNLGYDYLLLEKYPQAVSYFERACALFSAHGNSVEQDNSRLNRMRCEVETIPLEELRKFHLRLEEETSDVGITAHKRHFIESRMFERLGNVPKAIECCKKAIESCERHISNFKGLYKKNLAVLEATCDFPRRYEDEEEP